MKKIFLVFPNQIFEDTYFLKDIDLIYLIEDPLFFGDQEYPLKFHKFKLILHRASLKFYEEYLKKKSFQVIYLEYLETYPNPVKKYTEIFINSQVFAFDPVDYILEKRLEKASQESNTSITFLENPDFINTNTDNNEYLSKYKKEKLFQTDFYIYQRKRLKILLDKNNKPIGNKWSFDTENRKKLSKNVIPKEPNFPEKNIYVKDAEKYVNQYFSNNPPYVSIEQNDIFFTKFYPTTFVEAQNLLNDFIENKIKNFGTYQDALSEKYNFIYHSVLSSSINIGLFTPEKVLKEVIKCYENLNEQIQISYLNSVEGFIRQIIGWREFMRLVYIKNGTKMRNSNYFNHKKKLPEYWYNGKTNNQIIKNLVTKVSKLAYLHHIERLMIAGNYMLLDCIDPNEVYNWFMEMFIDSYDWVMVPNVYGMSQFADGGTITTKPYFSGSNYLIKMGYKNGNWQDDWDSKFWNFIKEKYDLLNQNQRTKILCKLLDKKLEKK